MRLVGLVRKPFDCVGVSALGGDVGVSALAGAECQTGSVLLEEEQNNDCHHHHELSFSMTAVISVQFDNSIKGPTLEQLRRTPSPPSSDLADSRA